MEGESRNLHRPAVEEEEEEVMNHTVIWRLNKQAEDQLPQLTHNFLVVPRAMAANNRCQPDQVGSLLMCAAGFTSD